MKKLSELRAERKALAKKVKDLVEEHPGGEAWTSEHEQQYQDLCNRIEAIDAELDRGQRILDIEAAGDELPADQIREEYRLDPDDDEGQARNNALAAFMRGGTGALTAEQRDELRNRVNHPMNTLSTGTGSEGGFLTNNEFAAELTVAMAQFGGMREVATVIQTNTGTQMDWPTTDPTSEEGEIIGENVTVGAAQNPVFGTRPLVSYKYSSKPVAVPFELLQDSLIDIEGYIRLLLAMRLGRVSNRHFTVGTGVGQPPGVIPASTVGKVGAAGQTNEFTYDDLVDLEHSVDPAYRNSARWMMHDNSVRDAKKIKDNQGRPLWLPSLIQGDAPTLMGYGYTVNQHMAVQAANALSLAFGDFTKYIIRDVMQVLLFRMTDSKYTELGQVGFLAFMRTGAQYVDVGGAVKTYQNAAA